jgi:hypothetical protein
MPTPKITKLPIPGLKILRVSRLSIASPYCKAKPARDCYTSSGGFSALHVAGIKAAAKRGAANKRSRSE